MKITIRLKSIFMIFNCIVFSVEAGAQDLARKVEIAVDNDYFNFWIPPRHRSDDNYTHGLRIKWNPKGFIPIGNRIACAKRNACGLEVALGQEIYTPTIDSPTPLPGQRPYAGWLFGQLTLRQGNETTAQNTGLIVGLTGPASLAEWVQNSFHKQFRFRQPLGWDHQLSNEPAFALVADRAWRINPSHAKTFDLVSSVAASVGTLSTKLTTGAQMRIGNQLGHPWLGYRSESWFSIQLVVGGKAEAVARDLFLDGNTFTQSVSVDKIWHRSSWNRGLSLRAARGTLEYDIVTEGRQYSTGPASHTYSSIRIAWNAQ